MSSASGHHADKGPAGVRLPAQRQTSASRNSFFGFVFRSSHSSLAPLLCPAPPFAACSLHPCPQRSSATCCALSASARSAEVWQDGKQLLPLPEKEAPPKPSLLPSLPCPALPSLGSNPASALQRHLQSPWQLSSLGPSQELIPRTWEIICGIASSDPEDAESWTHPGRSRARDFTGTSQPSVISTLLGRCPEFPVGILPGILDWESSASAVLPGASPPAAWAGGWFQWVLVQMETAPASSALRQGLCVPTPRSGQVLPPCRVQTSPCQAALASPLSAAGTVRSSCPLPSPRPAAALPAPCWFKSPSVAPPRRSLSPPMKAVLVPALASTSSLSAAPLPAPYLQQQAQGGTHGDRTAPAALCPLSNPPRGHCV